jgi:predicted DsbA family dithiol-disulfide isomerase/uncharacterized membrane protein
MRPRLLRFVAQVSILLAIAASAALLIDSVGVTPAYCSGATGCHAVKLATRRILGSNPIPLFGLLAFVSLLVVTTCKSGRVSRGLEISGALVAALCAILLLLVQGLLIRSFCPYCVVVDVSAILASLALLAARRSAGGDQSPQWLHPIATGGLALIAVVAPIAWPHFRPAAAVPPQLAEFTRPDRVSVVEFVDLSCGHCRALHPTLEKLRREQGPLIHFVRLHAPLPSHQRAREAARLLQCLAADQQRVEKLTEILFESPTLDQSATIAAARQVGMTEDEIKTCWANPSSQSKLSENMRRLELLGFQGLPTTYIGGERIVGAMPLSIYRATLDRVRRGSESAIAEATAFCVLFGMLVVGIIEMGRRWSRHSSQ